jgi:hypothetical protein
LVKPDLPWSTALPNSKTIKKPRTSAEVSQLFLAIANQKRKANLGRILSLEHLLSAVLIQLVELEMGSSPGQ